MKPIIEQIEVSLFYEAPDKYIIHYYVDGMRRPLIVEKDSEHPLLDEIQGEFCQYYALKIAEKNEERELLRRQVKTKLSPLFEEINKAFGF